MRLVASLALAGAMAVSGCMSETEDQAFARTLLPDGAGATLVSDSNAIDLFDTYCASNASRLRDGLDLVANGNFFYPYDDGAAFHRRLNFQINIRPKSGDTDAFCAFVWATDGDPDTAIAAMRAAYPDAQVRFNSGISITAFQYGDY